MTCTFLFVQRLLDSIIIRHFTFFTNLFHHFHVSTWYDLILRSFTLFRIDLNWYFWAVTLRFEVVMKEIDTSTIMSILKEGKTMIRTKDLPSKWKGTKNVLFQNKISERQTNTGDIIEHKHALVFFRYTSKVLRNVISSFTNWSYKCTGFLYVPWG